MEQRAGPFLFAYPLGEWSHNAQRKGFSVAFGHYGKALFEVFKFLGIQDIAYNQPKSLPYPTENPFR